jgi:hypothetical protein
MSQPSNSTLQSIAKHLVLAIQPLKRAVSDMNSFQRFMRRLGWHVQSLPPAYQTLATQVDNAIDAFQALGENPELTEVLQVIGQVEQLYHAIQNLTESPEGVDGPAFLAEIGKRLFELLLIDALAANLPTLYRLCRILHVIQNEFHAKTPTRPAFVRSFFHFSVIPQILADPLSIRERVYGWGTVDFDYDRIASHLMELFIALGFAATIEGVTPELSSGFLQTSGQDSGNAINYKIKIPIIEVRPSDVPIIIGLAVLELPAEDIQLPGIIVQPLVDSGLPTDLQIREDIFLRMREGTDLTSLFGIVIRPGEISVRYPFKPGMELPSAGFGLGLDVNPENPLLLLGSSNDTRVQLQGFSADFEVNYIAGELEVILGADLKGMAIILSGGSGDGFINKILGDNEKRIDIPLGVEWSNKAGIHFKGGGGFEVQLHPHQEFGPLSVDAIQLRLFVPTSTTPQITTEVGVSINGQLGPLQFTIEGVGIKLDAEFVDGNAGPFGIDLGFKSPTGVGLAIDGGGFKGGGFLRFDPANKRYEGMLELEFQDKIALKAIGLLTTQLPGGKEGFSLLIIITAEFTPIQLGFGFTLNGVGGLLGLNRTAKKERLRAGVKDNTLSSILFPTDIVANASRIISDLRQVFPPQEGRFIFGPMAKIAWGTPPLITIDLGLLIEVPDPVRLAILGVVKAVLPDEKAALLRLQVNFLGVINFEKKQLSFDASLYDSKLLSFPLSGDMAILLNWGNEPNFLLTVGGFHPAYEPPPMNLPNLSRLTLQLLKGNNPRLTLETYFAVTSNTAQFGAKLELYAAKGRFNVYGFLSFDALFQFNPFYFIADVSAMLALRSGSSSIASIKLDLTLEGTTPWKARGTAKLKLFWFLTVKIRFNKTFGEARDTTLPAVEVIPLLETALLANGNWQPQIPGRGHLLVSLKQVEAAADTIIVHPFGILEISQKVVPLNIPIDKFGNQKPGDGNEFHIRNVKIGSQEQVTADSEELFAPAQFFEKTDSEKLSSKSFEKYDSGIRIVSSEKLISDYFSKRDVEYELFYIDSQRDRRLLSRFDLVAPDADAFDAWAVNGAIADSDLSFAKNAKSALAPGEVAVGQENFAVVNTGNLNLFDDDSMAKSEEAALVKMEKLLQYNPALEESIQVVPLFEVNVL